MKTSQHSSWKSLLLSLIVLVVPVSPNFQLRELNVGIAGGDQAASTNFESQLGIGELSGPLKGTTVNGGIGFGFTQMANVPLAPTFTNPSSYYNKLHAVISTSNNPSDTLYAIAISSDGFVTTNYVQDDTTVGPALALADYQTYSAWGSGSGFDIIGLAANTTYAIKVKAMQGNFTESGYGPSASAATVNPSLTFDLDVAATDTESASPYILNLGDLPGGSVITGSDKVWVDLETNAESGANVYAYTTQAGLNSVSKGSTIPQLTGNLASASEGFGIRQNSVTQSGGGPLSVLSPFNGASDVIGGVTSTISQLLSSPDPITSGRGSFLVKAKSTTLTPSAADYGSVFTIIAAASF